MAAESIIVAIELGSSKISGIAGKKKEGTMQILAYAEEKTNACIKRGVVYNIEKTTTSIRSIIAKLESTLKLNISQVYVGIGGQSVRSLKSIVKRNLLTPTCINNNHIDSIRDESHEIPFSDCELLENFAQEFVVDSNTVTDPVGVMGTNIEGVYLNVVAKTKLKRNIQTSFNSTDLVIAGEKLVAYELANNTLTDTEKRSGCALVDLGAGTTTVVVYKNNIVRHLVTIPLGFNNITQDLCTLQIDEAEAEEVKIKYGNPFADDELSDEDNVNALYTTSDGRAIEVAKIQNIIDARLSEILANVNEQIRKSGNSTQLLGGIVITGGGANMKNITKALTQATKIEKVRVANKVTQVVIKNSNVTNFRLDNVASSSIISLLLSGEENCCGEKYDGQDMFKVKEKERENEERMKAEKDKQQKEEDAYKYIEAFKNEIRAKITNIQTKQKEVKANSKDKHLRNKAKELVELSQAQFGEEYDNSVRILETNDKYKQTLKEAKDLIDLMDEEAEKLESIIKEAAKNNSFWGKFGKAIDNMINESE